MNRIAHIGVVIEDIKASEKVNEILHSFSKYIIARMGVPYDKYNIMIISIVIDAPNEEISALTGKLSMINDVSAKAVYSKKSFNKEEE